MKSFAAVGMVLLLCAGCSGRSGNNGQLQSYPAPVIEAAWVRNGEPILFENKTWMPIDDIEVLMDSEVFQIGEYKNVQIFVEKLDTKPYERIYTKFSKGKYRYFERRDND